MDNAEKLSHLMTGLETGINELSRSYAQAVRNAATLQRRIDIEYENHLVEMGEIARALGLPKETFTVGQAIREIIRLKELARQVEREAVR